MPTRNINLTDHQDTFLSQALASGQYKNASEVVRAGLRLLESQALEEQAKLDALRNAFQEGKEAIERGEYDVLESADDIDTFFDQIDQETDQVN